MYDINYVEIDRGVERPGKGLIIFKMKNIFMVY